MANDHNNNGSKCNPPFDSISTTIDLICPMFTDTDCVHFRLLHLTDIFSTYSFSVWSIELAIRIYMALTDQSYHNDNKDMSIVCMLAMQVAAAAIESIASIYLIKILYKWVMPVATTATSRRGLLEFISISMRRNIISGRALYGMHNNT